MEMFMCGIMILRLWSKHLKSLICQVKCVKIKLSVQNQVGWMQGEAQNEGRILDAKKKIGLLQTEIKKKNKKYG